MTQEDIDQGVQSSCKRCPVALAIKRAFDAQEASVNDVLIRVNSSRNYPEPHVVFRTPEHVFELIQGYDLGIGMVPFKFTLREEDRA